MQKKDGISFLPKADAVREFSFRTASFMWREAVALRYRCHGNQSAINPSGPPGSGRRRHGVSGPISFGTFWACPLRSPHEGPKAPRDGPVFSFWRAGGAFAFRKTLRRRGLTPSPLGGIRRRSLGLCLELSKGRPAVPRPPGTGRRGSEAGFGGAAANRGRRTGCGALGDVAARAGGRSGRLRGIGRVM